LVIRSITSRLNAPPVCSRQNGDIHVTCEETPPASLPH
jgi:hypothetical protein